MKRIDWKWLVSRKQAQHYVFENQQGSDALISRSDKQKSEGESDSERTTRVERTEACASRIPSRKIVPKKDPQRACRDPQHMQHSSRALNNKNSSIGYKYLV